MSYTQDVHKSDELQFATPWRRYFPFLVGGVGVVLIVLGVGVSLWKQQNLVVESVVAETPQATEFVKGVNTVKFIKVDVSGAVVKPGLVEIPSDSRVQDVLITAGGFEAKADRTYISKHINLAQPVQDGMKIYIPFEGEANNVSDNSEGNNDSYNINNSSQAKLEELPGIGPVTAKKIIDNRPYQTIEEIVSKKAVSKSIYEKIKDQISLY